MEMAELKLYPFQQQDVQIAWGMGNRVLNASEVGTGKTLVSLACFLQCLGTLQAMPGLVVCPANLKGMWKRAAADFGIEAVVLNGNKPVITWDKTPRLFVINYDILGQVKNGQVMGGWIKLLKEIKPKFLILDEGHLLVNLKAKRTQLVIALAKRIPHVHILSGTPIVGKHWDLFAILHILDPERFDSPFSFGLQFCDIGESNGQEMVFNGSTNHAKLHGILKDYLIRHTKAEVLPDLPKLTRCILPFEIERRKEYDFAERDLIGWLSTYDIAAADRAARAARLVKFGYLKRLAADCKMTQVFDWIDNHLASTDGKLILGAWSRKTWPHVIQKIDERYAGQCVSVHGETKDKDASVDQFQNNPNTRIITLQLKSGGVGLNLQGAKRSMALIELPFRPGDVAQFLGRGHRIGTLDPVVAYFLLAVDTIEEKVCEILTKIQRIQDRTLDNHTGNEQSLNLLDELHKAMLAKSLTPRRKK